MGRRMNMVGFMVVVVAALALLQTSKAQTTHVVGDSLGWMVPPGGPIAYTTWASTQTFTVGDILVFNFSTGEHDVAEVTKAAFDSCNTTNPISISTNGPTNITLTSAGEHHFICTFSRHCGLGQKLAINVSVPSTSPATHVVGDSLGWIVPPGGPIAYANWASRQTFTVRDVLVFNFSTGTHDMAEVTKAAFDSCNTTNPISISTSGPTNITLNSAGEHHFICTFSRHCGLGQKLVINVSTAASTSPAPQPAIPPPPPSTPTPTPSPVSTPPATHPSLSPTPSSSSAPPPSSIATPPPGSVDIPPSSQSPPGVTAPPSPSSAPSFAVVTLPVTILSIALAFLY